MQLNKSAFHQTKAISMYSSAFSGKERSTYAYIPFGNFTGLDFRIMCFRITFRNKFRKGSKAVKMKAKRKKRRALDLLIRRAGNLRLLNKHYRKKLLQ